MSGIKDYITIDSEIQNGQPVFKGTRVPVETLFMHLENGVALHEFLDDFPGVSEEQAIAVLITTVANNLYNARTLSHRELSNGCALLIVK